MFSLSEDSIVENLERFAVLKQRFDNLISTDTRSENLTKMYEVFGDDLIVAPASSRNYYHNCYPGGYLEYVLAVVDNSLKVAASFKEMGGNIDFTKQELIFVALHHAVGKLGTEDGPYYLNQTSDWHRKRGELYKINDDIQFFKVSDRSLMLLQKYDVALTEKEWLAIKLADGMYEDSNKSYFHNYSPTPFTTMLPHILHWATTMTATIHKQKTEFKLD
jgi:hypothetical protein